MWALRLGGVLIFIAASALCPSNARAATCVWTAGGTASFSASTSNWSCGAIPGSGDDVYFCNGAGSCPAGTGGTANCTIDGTVTVNSLSINSTYSGTVTQSAGAITINVNGAFAQGGGTFTGGSNPIILGTNFSLTGGTFTSTSNRLEVPGAFSITGGTFNANSGRVLLSSSSSQTFASNGATFDQLYLSDGLLYYWKLDETSGTSAATSTAYSESLTYGSSGQAPVQATSTFPAVTFRDPAYLTFTRTSFQYASSVTPIPRLQFDATKSYTLSAWVKVNDLTASCQGVMTFGRDSSNWWGLWLCGSPNNLKYIAGSASVNAQTTSIVSSGWHHVTIVQSGSGASNRRYIYVDGLDKTSGTPTADNGSGNGTVYFGRGATSEYFDGSIDDVRVYNRALSAADITALASGGQPTTATATQTLTGSPTVSTKLVVSGGLAAGANTIYAGGDWFQYGGTFSSTGTVNFNGASTGRYILTNGASFNHLTISGAGGWAIADSGTKVTVNGDFSQSAGTFTSTSGLLKIGGAFNKTGGTFTHNSGRVMLSSTTSQTFASNGATFYDLTINDGLVGYWKLDDGSGAAARDSSGYGLDLASNAATWSTSSGPGLQYANTSYLTGDGSVAGPKASTSGQTQVQFTSSQSFTIAAWVNPASANASNYSALVALSRDTGNYCGLWISPPGGDPAGGNRSRFFMGAAGSAGCFGAYVTTGWHHIAVVQNGSTNHEYVYVDGVDTTYASHVANNCNGGGLLTLGYDVISGTNSELFNGSLDEVRIYNRALSTTEINSMYLGYQPASASATQTLTGSPTVANDLTIASGTLAAGSNAISVAGSWWNYGGTFTGTGSVTLNGSSTGKSILSGGQEFGGMTVSGSGSWTLGDALRIPSGTLAINAGTVTGSAYLLQAGTVTNSGGTFTPGSATVVVTGTSSPTVPGATYSSLRIEDPVESNLAGYWKLDAGTGSSVRDYSGNSLTGTFSGSPLWTNSVPGAISFNDPAAVTLTGANYVDVPTAVIPSNAAFTACAWVNLTSTAGYQTFISIDGTTISGFYLQLSGGTGKFAFAMRGTDADAGTLYQANATATAPLAGTWYHLCGVYTGSVARVYVNGGQQGSDVSVSASWNATGHTIIGAGRFTGGRVDYVRGSIDDVRVYNVALSSTQIAALAAGKYAGTGGTTTTTLAGTTAVNGTLAIDNGALGTSTYNLTTAATDATKVALITNGTLSAGSGTVTFAGGANVASTGILNLASTGTIAVGADQSLILDGRLQATGYPNTPTIQVSNSGSYTFTVGSSGTATPTLNIDGLNVKNTSSAGMYINAVVGSSTTFTKFDHIAFSNGTAGGQLLQIYAPSLYLTSNGCTFDAGTSATTTSTVKLVGDTLSSNGETRVIFGGATCSSSYASCQASKSDGDADNDGVWDSSATPVNVAVVQFLRGAGTDTAGTLVGLPTAAFDWGTFAYYSTYAAYNSASGTSPSVYVRDSSGTAKYAWTGAAGETIVGTPRWNTVGGMHYLYVAVASGKVYRLVDNGSSSLTLDGSWTTNPYDCGCTIVTPLSMDTNNLYWGGTQSGAQKLWTIGQSSETQPMGSPFTVTPTITSAAPLLWTSSGTSYVFFGTTGHLLEVDVTHQTWIADNTNPGSASIWGRIALATNTTNRVLAGDDAGRFWSIDPTNSSGTNKQWSYTVTGDTIMSSPYYDYTTNTVMFGTEGGKIVALTSAGAAMTGYPYTPGAATDVMRSAPLYRSGVLAVGSTTGKLFFLDRDNGTTGPALIREYYLGPTETISGVAFDANMSRYMVATSDSSAKDGKLYYIDAISDPTPGAP